MEKFFPGLPLLTSPVAEQLIAAQDRAEVRITVSLDLGRTTSIVEPGRDEWLCALGHFPYPFGLQPRTVYGWNGEDFQPLEATSDAIRYRLEPTGQGPPAIGATMDAWPDADGRSPVDLARGKALRIAPRGKQVLDCCTGLGYVAHACVAEGAEQVVAFDANPALALMRGTNPWSPRSGTKLRYAAGDLAQQILDMPPHSFDAVLRDPVLETPERIPAQSFFNELARVIVPEGLLLHGSSAMAVPGQQRVAMEELQRRLQTAGFVAQREGDWVVARMPRDAMMTARARSART